MGRSSPPRVPRPKPLPAMAMPAQPATSQANPVASTFSSFQQAPQLAGFAPRRAGRRSLVGGTA